MFDERNKSNKNPDIWQRDMCRKPEWESLSNDARVWKLTHSVNELSAV